MSARCIARRPAPSLHRMVPSMSKRTSFKTTSGSGDDEAGHDAPGAEALPDRRDLAEHDPGDGEGDERLQVAEHRHACRADPAHPVVPDEVPDDERADAAIYDRRPHRR